MCLQNEEFTWKINESPTDIDYGENGEPLMKTIKLSALYVMNKE